MVRNLDNPDTSATIEIKDARQFLFMKHLLAYLKRITCFSYRIVYIVRKVMSVMVQASIFIPAHFLCKNEKKTIKVGARLNNEP